MKNMKLFIESKLVRFKEEMLNALRPGRAEKTLDRSRAKVSRPMAPSRLTEGGVKASLTSVQYRIGQHRMPAPQVD